jgi:hypothetical protein
VSATRQPCPDCPWRKSSPRGVWPQERFENLARTCQGDEFQRMACHKSTAAKPLDCIGWVNVLGFDAIGVRLAAMSGAISGEDVPGEPPRGFFRSFDEMLRANLRARRNKR